MQFNIDQDTGSSISGWVAPDSPEAVPRVLISIPNREPIVVAANRSRPDIRELGMHSTGMVGFWLDQTIVPDLDTCSGLSIQEERSGVLIHRRHDGVPAKVFLLDSSLSAAAAASLRAHLDATFTLTYDALERHPFDTLFSVLNNQTQNSIFACGRLPFTRYHNVLRANGFVCAAILRHPFEELGYRLQIAHDAARGNASPAVDYATGLEPLVELMGEVNVGDLTGFQTAMQNLTAAQARVVANPHLRLLACDQDEVPQRKHIPLALEALATMDVVGSYGRFDGFVDILAEVVGHPVLNDYRPEPSYTARELAAVLARSAAIRKLLSLDLALHSYIEDAFSRADSELRRCREDSD